MIPMILNSSLLSLPIAGDNESMPRRLRGAPPHIDASSLAWTGCLDQPWSLENDPHGTEQPWPLQGLSDRWMSVTSSSPEVLDSASVRLTVVFDSGVKVVLLLSATPCRFGGQRWWLVCPGCRSKRAYLFHGGEAWVCRACGGWRYATQTERPPQPRRPKSFGATLRWFSRIDNRYLIPMDEARDRRNWRRRLSRQRAMFRTHPDVLARWPVAWATRPRCDS